MGQRGAILAAAGPQIYAREPTPATFQTVSKRNSRKFISTILHSPAPRRAEESARVLRARVLSDNVLPLSSAPCPFANMHLWGRGTIVKSGRT